MDATTDSTSPQQSADGVQSAELLFLFTLLAIAVGVTVQVLWKNYIEGKLSFTSVFSLVHPVSEAFSGTKELQGKGSNFTLSQNEKSVPGLSITVNRSRLVQSSKGTFAQFKVTSRCGEDEFIVWRRYSEFRKLVRAMRKVVKPLDEEQCLSMFPSKSGLIEYMSCADLDPDYLTKRAAMLETFFSSLFGPGPGSLASRRRDLSLELAHKASQFLGAPDELVELVVAKTKSGSEEEKERKERIDKYIKTGIESLNELHRHSESVMNQTGDMDGWKKYGSKKGIDIFLKPVGDQVYNIGQGKINAPMHAVIQMFSDPRRRHEFDDMFDAERDIEVIDPKILPKVDHLPGKPEIKFMTVRYSTYKKPAPFMSARDNLSVYTAARYEDGSVVIALRSTESPMCPETKKYVRTQIGVAGIVMKELTRETCMMTKMEAVDVGGGLPKTLVNQIGPLRAMMVHDIAKALRDKSKWPPFMDTPEEVDAFIMSTFQSLKDGSASG